MIEAESLIDKLKGTAVYSSHKSTFSERLDQLKGSVQSLAQEQGTLTKLTLCPDLHLLSSDGFKVPACKDELAAASPVVSNTLMHDTQESRTMEIDAGAPASAVRLVVTLLHSRSAKAPTAMSVADLMAACELAYRWELKDVLDRLALSRPFSSAAEVSADGACEVLLAAARRAQADPTSDFWKDVVEDASEALATFLSTAPELPAQLKDLDLAAFSTVLEKIKGETFELKVTVDTNTWTDAATYGPEVVVSPHWNLPQGYECKMTIYAIRNADGGMDVYLKRVKNSDLLLIDATIAAIDGGDGHRILSKWFRSRALNAQAKDWGFAPFAAAGILPTLLTDGVANVEAKVTITADQRRYEALNAWLLATGVTTTMLKPDEALICVRALACGVDVGSLTVAELRSKLGELDQPTDGLKNALVVRLRDALYSSLPRDDAVDRLCRSLAKVVAAQFQPARSKTLLGLDAMSMSDVLAQDILQSRTGEADVLAAAVKWASCEGRAVATIDKVMPLVRFPLVSMLSPSDELKALKQRSAVVAALVKEALELQLTPNEVQAFTPAKHPLFDGVLTSAETPVPRAKRRKLNPNDKVPEITSAEILSAQW